MPANQTAVDFSNPSLLYALAWTLIEQKERPQFRIWGQEFTREQCLYEIYRHLSSYLPDLRIRDFRQLDDEGLLKDFARAVLEAIKEAVPEASRPATEKLQALVEEYQTHLEEMGQSEELRKELFSENLRAQLEKIKNYHQFRALVKNGVKKEISPFYAEEFKEQVADDVAERLFQETAAQVRAAAATDEAFVKAALEKIFQESREADIAFSSGEKTALTTLLTRTLTSEELKTPQLVEGFLAQTELVQTSLPKRETTLKKIAEIASLKTDNAREALNKTETLRLGTNQPTELEVREVLRQALRPYGVLPEERINQLVPYVQHYLAACPVSRPQNQPLPAFISQQALRVARKLQLAPTTVQDALDGLNVSLLERLKARPGISEAQRQLFTERIKSLKTLETALAETSGFRFLKLRIAWNQKRAQLLNLFDENNPLSPVFYQLHFPDLRNKYLEKRKYYQATGQYLKTTSPLRFFFAPRQQFQTAVGGWWNGLLARSETLSSLVSFLPKLKPSYWLGQKLGGFLVRKGAAWAAETGIKAFGGRALGFIGSKLLGKAAGSIIGTALGGPVGTVVGMAAGAVLGKILDKSKGLIKKALAIGAAALGLLIGFLFSNVITGLLALGGGILGFMVGGPIGALIGAGAGAGLGHLFSGLFGKGAAAQAASSAAGTTSALLSAPATATVAAPVAAAPVVAVGATAIMTATIVITKGGAFLPKPEELAELSPYPQSKYFQVEKKALPKNFSSAELEQIWNRGEEATVTYEIKITAKEKDITITRIEDEFSVYPRGPTTPSPLTGISLPTQISAGESISYQYQLGFGRQYLDSVVSNTIVVTANVAGGPNDEQSSDRAAVVFGQAPTLCFEFNGPWTEEEESLEIQAMGYLSHWPHFTSLLCSYGPITLTKMAGTRYGGWAKSINEIVIYDKGLGSYHNTLYTLTHEAGHLIDHRNDQLRARDFRKSGVSVVEGFLPTYPEEKSEAEDFAETIALYVAWDKVSFRCCGKINYPKEFPRHYNFAEEFIFKP